MKLILIRHGLSTANIKNHGERYFTGQLDCELSEEGKNQAKALKNDPRILAADAFYASDLLRTRETAACLTDRPVIYDARLRERSMGELEGHFQKEVENDPRYVKYFTDPALMHFQNDFVTKAPGGENYTDVCERVCSFLKELGEKPFESAVLVSHYCAIRCILHVLGLITREETVVYPVKNCLPVEVQFDPDKPLII